jgi:hypothetical protein
MSGGEMVKIRYAVDETGWGERPGDDRCRIANIPLADRLNIDDEVVVYRNSRGELCAGDVVRRAYRYKTAIGYKEPGQYAAFRDIARAKGAKVEGTVSPYERNGEYREGILLCAHNDDFDPAAEALALGIQDPELPDIGEAPPVRPPRRPGPRSRKGCAE